MRILPGPNAQRPPLVRMASQSYNDNDNSPRRGEKELAPRCSAELHSAVSQNCIRLGTRLLKGCCRFAPPADCKSAIRQSATLRYVVAASLRGLASGPPHIGTEDRSGGKG